MSKTDRLNIGKVLPHVLAGMAICDGHMYYHFLDILWIIRDLIADECFDNKSVEKYDKFFEGTEYHGHGFRWVIPDDKELDPQLIFVRFLSEDKVKYEDVVV